MWLLYVVFEVFLCKVPFVSSVTETSLSTTDGLTSDRITTHYFPESTTESTISNAPISIEILRMYVPYEAANSVKLIWGKEIDNYNSNLTYGIHYGYNEDDLNAPKLTTNNLSALIEDLDYCTKYIFAVSVANNDYKINANNIRSIVTHIDKLAAPEDFHVDFETREGPCLLIKWSSSCSSIGEPIGYIISTFEKRSSRYVIVTLPRSKRVDFIYNFKVNYDTQFDIKVATNFPGSNATDTVTYKVPGFLQPYKVRITTSPDGAFMIYWSQPFIPYYVGKYYYQVNVYRGDNISTEYEKYYVTRPVITYKGNESIYTFVVGTVSYDRRHRSLFTNPIVGNLNEETREIVEK